ncbi:hypothetical protein [Coxiella-like endosymbiont of Rhipicephalus sanguineus]|nr:hypothetical protein [Coxiella-like endosymbiont of Rhipicephalus sanguineus]
MQKALQPFRLLRADVTDKQFRKLIGGKTLWSHCPTHCPIS